jgi:hypothetical protein
MKPKVHVPLIVKDTLVCTPIFSIIASNRNEYQKHKNNVSGE